MTRQVNSFNFEKLAIDEMQRVRDWAYGLFLAHGLRPGIWGLRDGQNERMLERQEGSAWAAAVVSAVGLPEALDDAAEEDGGVATEEEKGRMYLTMFGQLPDAVATLIEHAGKRRHQFTELLVVKKKFYLILNRDRLWYNLLHSVAFLC